MLESSLSSLTVKEWIKQLRSNVQRRLFFNIHEGHGRMTSSNWTAKPIREFWALAIVTMHVSWTKMFRNASNMSRGTCLQAYMTKGTYFWGPAQGGGAHHPTYTWRDPATRNKCAGKSGKMMTDKFTINVATSPVDNKLLANESLFVIFWIIHHMQRYVALNHGCKRGETQTQTTFAAISTYLTRF